MLSDMQQQFLLTLREFRPELAEFRTLCLRSDPGDNERSFIVRRMQRLAQEGRALHHDRLMARLDTLQQALQNGASRENLASLTEALLDAALYALTFSGDAPASAPATIARKWRLVVADDDRIVREMMVQLFSDETELHAASNGREAHALIQEHRPHLVILDDFMPGMTGLKLIEILHATKELSHIPVMMLTGSDRERDKERAMQAGAVGYITKPFNPAAFKEIVQKKLNKIINDTILD